MKKSATSTRTGAFFVSGYLGGLLAGAALIIGGCAATQPTAQQRADYLEPMLSAAGFRMVAAQTPDKIAKLNQLPPLKVNYFLGKEGEPHYWFADPYSCHCLYVGDQDAYRQFENLRIRDRIARQEKAAAEENLEASQNLEMESMTPWGFWGPGPGWMY